MSRYTKIMGSKIFLWQYFGVIIYCLLLFILNRLGVISPWFLNLLLLSALFLPGFFLKRLIRINFKADLLGNLILMLALGFIFNLLLALIVILIGLTITGYLWFFIIFGLLILILAIIRDIIQPSAGEESQFIYKNIF